MTFDARDLSRFDAAVRRADKGQWALGELLVELVPPRAARRDELLAELAQRAREQGFPGYSVSRLGLLRDLAAKWKPDERPDSVEVAREAGTPAILRKAERMAVEEGTKVTKRQVRAVRQAVHADARRSSGAAERPTRRPAATHIQGATSRPTSETRRTADVLGLGVMADKASRLGRQFVEGMAGRELTTEETEELTEDIERVLATWKAAQQAVKRPLSAEAEEFLRGIAT